MKLLDADPILSSRFRVDPTDAGVQADERRRDEPGVVLAAQRQQIIIAVAPRRANSEITEKPRLTRGFARESASSYISFQQPRGGQAK